VSEAVIWTMVVGLAVAIAAVSMLSFQVEQQTRDAFEAGLRNATALLQERFHNRPCRNAERTAAGASKAWSTGKRAGVPERRTFARRRIEDVFPSLKTRRSGI
jgi:hypothetical protein